MSKRQKTLFSIPGFEKVNVPDTSNEVPSVVGSSTDDPIDLTDINLDGKSIEEVDQIKKAIKAWCPSWKDTFPWVRFDKTIGRVFCTWCEKDPNNRTEYGRNGSINIKLSAIKNHAKSESHKISNWVVKDGRKSFEEGMKKQALSVDTSVQHLFRSAYFIAKHNFAFTDFEDILIYLRASRAPDVPRGIYENGKACAIFIKYLSIALKESILTKIKFSKYYSVMIDESTDHSSEKHLIIYVCFMENSYPCVTFFELCDVNDESGLGIFEVVKKLLLANGLSLVDCVGFGSDGASSMVGSRVGVATLFKKHSPFMTAIHCIAHRTNLCVVNAVKKSDFARHVDEVVSFVASIFSRSSKRIEKLKVLEEEFDCSIVKLKKLHKIRWLSRQQVLSRFCDVLEPLLAYLQEEDQITFSKVANFKFIYSIHFLVDILGYMNFLSKMFQMEFVDVTTVSGLVESEVCTIQLEFIEDPIIDINSYQMDSRGYPIIPDYGPKKGYLAALRGALKGNFYMSIVIDRDIDGTDLQSAIDFQKQFSSFIIKNLKKRFKDSKILSSLKILSPCVFPLGGYRELKSFGDDDVDNLVNFYGKSKKLDNNNETIEPFIDSLSFRREFTRFKMQVSNEWKGKSLRETWLNIGSNETWREKYPNMLKLAKVALLQCSSTAACERGFSMKNWIKDKLRNSLSTSNVDALMRICIEGPPLDDSMDFSHAIELWKKDTSTSRHIYGYCEPSSSVQV